MKERPMQDALLIYYVVANVVQAGYFAHVARAARQAVKQLNTAVIGLQNSIRARAAAGTRPQMVDYVPAVCRELEDWMERLTRMESYVLSTR
jgi:hypothetical protein